MTHKYAHATLLTDEKYLPCLIYNLKRRQYLKFQYPTVVMITDNISLAAKAQLEELGVLCVQVNKWQFQNAPEYFQDTLSKVNALTLTNFEKVLMLDADCINVYNNEYLFDIDLPDKSLGFYVNQEKYNAVALNTERLIAGVFLIIPNLNLYAQILTDKNLISCYNDEELWKQLYIQGQVYNLSNVETLRQNYYLHFGGRVKLWELDTLDPYLHDLLNMDTTFLHTYIDNNYSRINQINERWTAFLRDISLERTRILDNELYQQQI